MRRLTTLPNLLLIIGSSCISLSLAGDFAAVPGTGWTDISKLESTCSIPGYFVNPTDCSRFYQCVDHSTPEKRLYLRYDFECAAGTAFDEANKICNFPGPSGCITGGGGGGWGSGWGSGWSKSPVLWKTPLRVTKPTSWGSPPTGQTIITRVSSTPAPLPIPSNPRIVVPSSGWESFKIRNPGTSGIFQRVQISTTAAPPLASVGWSDVKVVNPNIFQSVKVSTTPSPATEGWGASRITLPVEPSPIFQSARVTPVPQAEWEIPPQFPVVPQNTIIENSGWAPPGLIRVTPAPTPIVNPNPIRIVEGPRIGWSSNTVRITPSPSPPPANPTYSLQGGVIYNPTPVSSTPAPSIAWQTANNPASPAAALAWQSSRLAPQLPQSAPQPYNPSIVWQGGSISPPPPSVDWQSTRTILQQQGQQDQQPVRYTWSSPQIVTSQQQSQIDNGYPQRYASGAAGITVASNANQAASSSFNVPAPPGGWENVKLTQLPSGYAWQSTGPLSRPGLGQPSTPILVPQLQQQQNQLGEGQEVGEGNSGSGENETENGNSLQNGNFGIIQQVINEEQGNSGESAGKSHIQLIYEKKENQSDGQNIAVANQVQSQGDANAAAVQIQQGDSAGSRSPSNSPVYEVVSSPGSGIKGKIIVLYAPFSTNGGKREVPVIEVQLDDDGNIESVKNEDTFSNK